MVMPSYRGTAWPSSLEAAGLGSNGIRRGRLAVAVGGVTSIQGVWESHGAPYDSVSDCTRRNTG
jgi:hypothetical protein